jgi:glycerol uptake facilitator protein
MATKVRYGKTGWRATAWGELLSEYLGTLVLLALGAGSVAVAVVGLTMSGRTVVIFQGAGGWMLIGWGWAIAVAMAVYVAGGISGAHLNPAVTFAQAIKGNLPWKKVVPYWIAQVLGAFSGALIVYADYYKAIDQYNLVHHVVSRGSSGGLTTFSIFATFPASYFHGSWVGPIVDQIIGTAFLLLFILAINDARNMAPISNLGPFIVGLAVLAIGLSFGTDAGYAINPARDFGPRLMTWLFGWGKNAFPGPGQGGYWWIPIVGPLIGAAIAVGIYKIFIEMTLDYRAKHPAEVAQETATDELEEGMVTSD